MWFKITIIGLMTLTQTIHAFNPVPQPQRVTATTSQPPPQATPPFKNQTTVSSDQPSNSTQNDLKNSAESVITSSNKSQVNLSPPAKTSKEHLPVIVENSSKNNAANTPPIPPTKESHNSIPTPIVTTSTEEPRISIPLPNVTNTTEKPSVVVSTSPKNTAANTTRIKSSGKPRDKSAAFENTSNENPPTVFSDPPSTPVASISPKNNKSSEGPANEKNDAKTAAEPLRASIVTSKDKPSINIYIIIIGAALLVCVAIYVIVQKKKKKTIHSYDVVHAATSSK